MRKLLPKILPLLLAASVTAGCGIVYKQPIYQGNLLEKTNVDQLQAGMDKQQVLLLLGTPQLALEGLCSVFVTSRLIGCGAGRIAQADGVAGLRCGLGNADHKRQQGADNNGTLHGGFLVNEQTGHDAESEIPEHTLQQSRT